MAYTLPNLPYPPDALEPSIDKMTMEIHHGRHHKAYVDNLNKALEGHADLANKPIDQLLREINKVPEKIRQAVINSTGPLLLVEFFPASLRAGAAMPHEGEGRLDVEGLIESLLRSGKGELYDEVIRAVERVLLPRVLRHTQGHQAQASDLLGLNRTTLRTKLRDLGLSVERIVSDAPQSGQSDRG